MLIQRLAVDSSLEMSVSVSKIFRIIDAVTFATIFIAGPPTLLVALNVGYLYYGVIEQCVPPANVRTTTCGEFREVFPDFRLQLVEKA